MLAYTAYEVEYFQTATQVIIKFALSVEPGNNINSIRSILSNLFHICLSGTYAPLKNRLEIPKSIKAYGIDKKVFMKNLDQLVRLAYDDQCTGANPVYPLMSDIKQIYLDAFEGKY